MSGSSLKTLLLFSPLALAAVAGCDDEAAPSPAFNAPPVASAGPDLTHSADEVIRLDGAASYDPDGDEITFHWSLHRAPEGSALMDTILFPDNHTEVDETVLRPDVAGTYIVELRVRDDSGLLSAADLVVVTVVAGERPVADARASAAAVTGEVVSLDGSRSYDPLGRPLTYSWTLSSAPANSALSLVDSSEAAVASMTPDVAGQYVVSLVVDNGLISSVPDTAYVEVSSADPQAPHADAGRDRPHVEDCTAVEMDGAGSYDPDGGMLDYEWTLQSKPEGSLTSSDSFGDRGAEVTDFYPDIAGTYTISLAVHDGESWSAPDLMTLGADERRANSFPVVEAGGDQLLNAGTATCVRDGRNYKCDPCGGVLAKLGADAWATDADGDPIDLQWRLVGEEDFRFIGETGTLAEALLSTEPEEPYACIDKRYTFELRATDCPGAIGADQLDVTVTCCGVP